MTSPIHDLGISDKFIASASMTKNVVTMKCLGADATPIEVKVTFEKEITPEKLKNKLTEGKIREKIQNYVYNLQSHSFFDKNLTLEVQRNGSILAKYGDQAIDLKRGSSWKRLIATLDKQKKDASTLDTKHQLQGKIDKLNDLATVLLGKKWKALGATESAAAAKLDVKQRLGVTSKFGSRLDTLEGKPLSDAQRTHLKELYFNHLLASGGAAYKATSSMLFKTAERYGVSIRDIVEKTKTEDLTPTAKILEREFMKKAKGEFSRLVDHLKTLAPEATPSQRIHLFIAYQNFLKGNNERVHVEDLMKAMNIPNGAKILDFVEAEDRALEALPKFTEKNAAKLMKDYHSIATEWSAFEEMFKDAKFPSSSKATELKTLYFWAVTAENEEEAKKRYKAVEGFISRLPPSDLKELLEKNIWGAFFFSDRPKVVEGRAVTSWKEESLKGEPKGKKVRFPI